MTNLNDFDLGATRLPPDAPPLGREIPTPTVPKGHIDTQKIINALTRSYTAAGVGLATAGKLKGSDSLVADGAVLIGSANELAESWRELLDNDPKVRKALKKLIETSGWTAVIMAHGGLIATIAKENHGATLSGLIRRRTHQATPV